MLVYLMKPKALHTLYSNCSRIYMEALKNNTNKRFLIDINQCLEHYFLKICSIHTYIWNSLFDLCVSLGNRSHWRNNTSMSPNGSSLILNLRKSYIETTYNIQYVCIKTRVKKILWHLNGRVNGKGQTKFPDP